MKQRVSIIVSGRVQGVGFRRAAQKQARHMNLTGWAHNLTDGSVEIVVEGEKNEIEIFLEWVKQGPSFAKVSDFEVNYETYTGDLENFEVREFGF
jgi:acylphosphatase